MGVGRGITIVFARDWVVEVVAHELLYMVSQELMVKTTMVLMMVRMRKRKGSMKSKKRSHHRLRQGLDRGCHRSPAGSRDEGWDDNGGCGEMMKVVTADLLYEKKVAFTKD